MAGFSDYLLGIAGGDFWVFLKKDTDTYSVLYHVRGSDGAVTTWQLTGHWIVGAVLVLCALYILVMRLTSRGSAPAPDTAI